MDAKQTAFLTNQIKEMREQANDFEARQERENSWGGSAITSAPFAIVDATCSLAIDREGDAYRARPIQSHLCDMVLFNREDAKLLVSALCDNNSNTNWQMVPHRELAGICAQSLRSIANELEKALA